MRHVAKLRWFAAEFEGFDDFGSWAATVSGCLTVVFISACEAGFFPAFFGSAFSADFFSLSLFAVDLSFGEAPARESSDVFTDVLPGDLAGMLEDATAPSFSPGFRSSTLRGLVATCGGGFAATAEGVGPVALTVLNATGLSGVVVLGVGA
jgi:hypothetical protein